MSNLWDFMRKNHKTGGWFSITDSKQKRDSTWVDADEQKKYAQIEKNRLEAAELNNKKRADAKELKNRIADMDPYKESSDEVQTNLMYDTEFNRELEERFDELSRNNKLPDATIVEAYVDTLYTRQPWVSRSKLLSFSDAMDTEHTLLEGVRYNGRIMLTDGNHRAVISKLASQEKIRVNIIDLDNPKKWWRRH